MGGLVLLRTLAQLCAAFAFGLVGVTLAAAQQPSKVPRIGWLANSASAAVADGGSGDFQQGLRDLGYVEGKNVIVEYRFANGDGNRLADFAAELARMPVDVIVTSGTPAALAAKRATKTIPIVATEFGLDPVKAGLVSSLGRPEGNVTGLASMSEDLWPKRLNLLKEIAPKAARIAVLWNPANPGNAVCVDELSKAAPTFRMQLRPFEVRDAKTLEGAFAAIVKAPVDWLAICWDAVTLANAKAIADFALKQRLSTLAPLREYVVAGALVSYGASLPAERRRSAFYVNKILKGAKPSDLPVERAQVIDTVLNAKTVRALGLTLPATVGLTADEIIE
jgi:putative ABC transport system substrate-binding protein